GRTPRGVPHRTGRERARPARGRSARDRLGAPARARSGITRGRDGRLASPRPPAAARRRGPAGPSAPAPGSLTPSSVPLGRVGARPPRWTRAAARSGIGPLVGPRTPGGAYRTPRRADRGDPV